MEEEPGGRSHNYEFSHVAMRIKFLSHPEGLFELVSDENHGAGWLDWFWRRPVASNVEDAMRRGSGGLRLETGRFEGHQFALIVPPPPREAPGAYAIALVVDETTGGQETARYFVLERMVGDGGADEEKCVLGEWTSDEHRHLGTVDGSGKSVLMEAVCDLLGAAR